MFIVLYVFPDYMKKHRKGFGFTAEGVANDFRLGPVDAIFIERVAAQSCADDWNKVTEGGRYFVAELKEFTSE
jgi:hypothetical protein